MWWNTLLWTAAIAACFTAALLRSPAAREACYRLDVRILEREPAGSALNLTAYYDAYRAAHVGDSGVDLPLPAGVTVRADGRTQWVPLGIQAAMMRCDPCDDEGACRPSSYYLYGRSSLANRPLALANPVGVIDAGFRGTLSIGLRALHGVSDPIALVAGERLAQICAPDLSPVHSRVVRELARHGTRGEAAIGSTG